ncbi:MAG TPA: hypothetical protein VFD43_11820 [Planctomycetota bacterium]|nr:hypothetical protein [Planctomycetota bacterium]
MRPMFLAAAPLLLGVLALAAPGAALGCARASSDDYEASLLAVGATIPDVSVTGMDDQALALSSLRGKTLLLNFWFYH